MRSIFIMLFALIVVSGFTLPAVGQEMPRKVSEYLRLTAEEAAIPIYDLEYEPNPSLVFGTFGGSPRVGKIGFVLRISVNQIIDASSARVALHWRGPARYRTDGPLGKEFYKYDDLSQDNVIIRGLSTSGMVDDATYKLERVLEIVGTEKYETALGGTKTVFVVKPFDIEPYKRMFLDAADARVKTVQDAKRKAERESHDRIREELHRQLTREWVDVSGRFTSSGELIEIETDEIAKIRKDDGATIRIKLSQFSRRDRD